jgi:hypothetical protein
VVGLALTAGTLRAQHAPAAATYLGNEITKVVQTEQDRFFLVKLDLALRAPAHRWYAVDVEFRLQQAQPLMLPHGKLLMRRWDNLFTPDQKSAVHWSDIRVDVDFSLLEQASNLPREQTFPIWVMGVLWDHANNRYVGSGWSARTALLVTTDAGGKISHAEPLDVLPQPMDPENQQATIPAERLRIATSHLQPREGVQAVGALSHDAAPRTLLRMDGRQARQPQSFGQCFNDLDSPQAAVELVHLQHPNAIVIRTREQWTAIESAVLAVPAARATRLVEPPGYGEYIEPFEGFGWRVNLLLLEPTPDGHGDVVYIRYIVSRDGMLGRDQTLCLQAPPRASQRRTAAELLYSRTVEAALRPDESDRIEPLLVGTGEEIRIPLCRGDSPAESRSDAEEVRPAPLRLDIGRADRTEDSRTASAR